MNQSSQVRQGQTNNIGGSFESTDVANVDKNVLARLIEGLDLGDKTGIIGTEFSPCFARICLKLEKEICVL